MTEEPTDLDKRTRWLLSPKPKSDGLRQKLSDGMKAFNKRTGKSTIIANRLIARRRKAKKR